MGRGRGGCALGSMCLCALGGVECIRSQEGEREREWEEVGRERRGERTNRLKYCGGEAVGGRGVRGGENWMGGGQSERDRKGKGGGGVRQTRREGGDGGERERSGREGGREGGWG